MDNLPVDRIALRQFRQFVDFEIEDFRRFNLLVGANNSGKTSILEALELFCRPLDVGTWVEMAWRREIKSSRTPLAEALKWLFPRAVDYPKPNPFQIVITGRGEFPGRELKAICEEFLEVGGEEVTAETGRIREEPEEEEGVAISVYATFNRFLDEQTGENRELRNEVNFKAFSRRGIRYPSRSQEPFLEVASLSPFAHRVENLYAAQYSKALTNEGLKENLREEFIRILQRIDPEILDIHVVDYGHTTSTISLKHARTGQTPISAFGDGIRRALLIALSIPAVRNGVLLIDELETALHVSVLDKVLEVLVWAAKEYNVQVFATTHSLEAVDAVIRAHGEDLENLAAYRLSNRDGQVSVTRDSGSSLKATRMEFGYEVR